MKLLFCPACWDVFKLSLEYRKCSCGMVAGRYLDNRHAVVNGRGVSLAINNFDLLLIRDRKMPVKNSHEIRCWVRPHEGNLNPNTEVVKEPTEE